MLNLTNLGNIVADEAADRKIEKLRAEQAVARAEIEKTKLEIEQGENRIARLKRSVSTEERNFASKLTSRRRRETVLADARSIAPIGLDSFDKNKMLLNCANGTLNFNDMTFHNHDPADYVTKMTRAKYDPEARCQRWERFVDEVMCGDADTAKYLQKALGYACTGDTSLEKMWLLYGATTRNGKSTAKDLRHEWGRTDRIYS